MKKLFACILAVLFMAGCSAPAAPDSPAAPVASAEPDISAAPVQTSAPAAAESSDPAVIPTEEPVSAPASDPNVYEETALSVTDSLVKFLAPVGKAMVDYDHDLLSTEFVWQVLLDLAEDRLHAEENGVTYRQITFSTLVEKEQAQAFVERYFALPRPSVIDETNPLVKEGRIKLHNKEIELIEPETDPVYSAQVSHALQNAQGDLQVNFYVYASYSSGKGELCGYAQASLKKDDAAYFGYTLQDVRWISRDPLSETVSEEMQSLLALLAAASYDSGLPLHQLADPQFAYHLLWRAWQSGSIPARYITTDNAISSDDLQTVLQSLLWITQLPELPQDFTRITYDAANDRYIFHADSMDHFSVSNLLLTKQENMLTYTMQVNRHLPDGSREVIGNASARTQALRSALFKNLGIEFQYE